jgi:two-component system, LytTR family, response regulator
MIYSINIKSNESSKDLQLSTIIRIEASSSYSKIFFINKNYPLIVSKVLHWFEDNLSQSNFIRTHKSHLINEGFIREINDKTKQVVLQSGETIAVSRRKYTAVKKIIVAKKLAVKNGLLIMEN